MVSSRGNVGSAGIDERASRLSADKLQSEHQGCDAGSARSQRFVEGAMTTSSASDRRIEAAETVDDVFAARSERSSQVESEAIVQWVSGSKRRREEEVEEVAVGLMRSVSVDPDDDEEEDSASLEVEESGKLSAAGLEVQQAAAEIVMSKHSGSAASAQGKNLADTAGPSLVQSPAAVQPAAVRSCVVAIESSRSQSKTTSSSQVLETPMRSSPGLVVAVNPPAPGFIAGGGGGGEERVCPVCRVFASPSYTALNVHIDQCLEQDAPAANSMDRLQNRTQTLQQQQQQGSRQQKFKVKTQKKRSMADLCAFAPRRDLQEDSGKSGSGSRESSPAAADSPEIAGPAARRQQHPEIRRQPRTAFVRGAGPEPPAAAATAPKKVRSYGTAPMTAAVAGRFAGPTTAGAGTHPQGGGILLQQHRAAKKQRLSTTTSDSAANSNFPQLKRPICAVDQEQQQWNSSDLHTKHKRRKLLSGKHATTVRVNSSSSPTVSTGVKKTSPSSVPLQKQNSIGSAAVIAGAHKGGASSSSSLPELQQLPSSLKQSSKEAKVWSKEKLPDCSKDPENLPVVVRGKPGDLKDNAALEDEEDEDEVHQLDVVQLVAQNQIECAPTTSSPNGLADEPGLRSRPGVLSSDKDTGLGTSVLEKIPAALEKKQPQAGCSAPAGSMSKIARTAANGTVVSPGAALSTHEARKLGLSTSTTKSQSEKSCTAATKENGSEPRQGSPIPVKAQDLSNSKSSLGIGCEAEDHTGDQLVNPPNNNNPSQCTAINQSAPELNRTASVVDAKETLSVLEQQQQQASLTSNAAAGEGGEGNMGQPPTGKGKKLSRKKGGDPVGSLMKSVTNKNREPNARKEKLKRKRPFLGYTEKEAPHLMSRSNAILREVLGLKQRFGEGGTPVACKPFECRVGSSPTEKVTALQADNPPAGEKTQLPDTSANVTPSFQRGADSISKDAANVSGGIQGVVDPILESQDSGAHLRSEVEELLSEKATKEKPKDGLQHFEEGEIHDLNQSPDSGLQVPSSHLGCSTDTNPRGMTGKSLLRQTSDSQRQASCELEGSQTPEDQQRDMREVTPVQTQSSPKRADWSPTLSQSTSKRKSLMKSTAVCNTLGATNTKDAGEPARKSIVPPRGPGGRFISTKSAKEGGDNASGSSTKSTVEVLANGPKVQSTSKSNPIHTLLSPPHRPASAGLCDGVPQIDTLKTGPSTSVHSSISEAPAQAAGYPDSDHFSDERLQDLASPITHTTVKETARCTTRGGSIEPIDTYRASPSPQQPNVSALCGSKTPPDAFGPGATPDNLPIGVRRSPVSTEHTYQATGNQQTEKSPTVIVQAGTIASMTPLQYSSTNSMTSPLVSGGLGTSATHSLTGGQTKAVAELGSQVAKLPGWIRAAMTEQPPTSQTSQNSQALTDSRDFERSRASVSPAHEGISPGDPSIVRLFGNPVLRLMGKNVLVSNEDKGSSAHKQQTTEASPFDLENLKELQAGKAVDVTGTSTVTVVHTGVGTAEAVLEKSDATTSAHVSGAAGWGPSKEVETSDGNLSSSPGNPMLSLVRAPSEAVNRELVVPWQAGDANQHVNKGSNKHSLDLQFDDSTRKGGLASDVEWRAENSLVGLDATTNLSSFSTSLAEEPRSPAAPKIKRKSLSSNGRGGQPPPGQEVIIIDDLPGIDSPPEPRHQELTIDALIKAGALRRVPPELDGQASKSKAPGARGQVMELDRSRIPQLSGVSQSDFLVQLRKLGLVPATHMAPRSFTSPQVPRTDHNSTNHKVIAPKPPHAITPSGIPPDNPTTAPSPRNLSPSTGGEALGLPPWLLAAKKQKDAQMAVNLIVLDDDDPADESPSSSSKISVHVPLGSPSPCSTGSAARAHARYSTPLPVTAGIAPVTKLRGQGTTSLLQSAVLRQAGGLNVPNTGVNLGISMGSGRSRSGMMSPRFGERGYQQESVGVVLPSPHTGDASRILERREAAACLEKGTSPVSNSHCNQIEQAGKLPRTQDKLVETVCEGTRPRNESNLSSFTQSWISGINGGLKRGGTAQTRTAPPGPFPTETDATHSSQLETLGLLDCLGIKQPTDGMNATKTSSVTSRSSTAPLRWEDRPGAAAADLRLQAESTAPPDSRSILFQHPISQGQASHRSADTSVNLHNGSELREHTPVDSIQATGIPPNLARTLSSHRTQVPSAGALLTDTRASMRSIEQPLRPAALGSLLERRSLPHMLERLVTSSDGSMSVEKGMGQAERQVNSQHSVSRGTEQQASPGIPSNMTKGTLFPEIMVRNGEEAQVVKAPPNSIPGVSSTIKRHSSLGRVRQQSLSGNSSIRDIPDLMTMTPLGKQVARNAFYREKQPMDSSAAQASIDAQTGSEISGLCSMRRSQDESFSHTLTRQISAGNLISRQQEQVLSRNQQLRNHAGSMQMFTEDLHHRVSVDLTRETAHNRFANRVMGVDSLTDAVEGDAAQASMAISPSNSRVQKMVDPVQKRNLHGEEGVGKKSEISVVTPLKNVQDYLKSSVG